jgi:hypothetical protein
MGATAQLKPITASEAAALLAQPDDIEAFLFPDDVDDPFEGQADLEKAWHAIHYVLTGSHEPDGTPLGDAVLGGVELGPDLGHGRARLICAERVVQISEALAKVDFAANFEQVDKSPERLTAIYRGAHLAIAYDYLAHWYPGLVEIYARAASQDKAMLVYLA